MEKRDALTALSALAHETRLDLFRALVRAGPEGLAAGLLAEAVDTPAPTVSFHLKELRLAGLVQARRIGRSIVYSAAFVQMSALTAFLMENCCAEGVAPPARRGRSTNLTGDRP